MTQPTRILPARLRNYLIYQMRLTGEVKASGWGMQVDRDRLLGALDIAIGPPPAKGRRAGSAGAVTLVVCERGVSVRSRERPEADHPPDGPTRPLARDIAGVGIWASPIVARGARLRSLVAGLPGPEVRLEYSGGRLMVDWKEMKGREL